jgi:lysophospholipase L1-like esterase
MSAAGRRGGGAPLVPLLNERILEIGGAENMAIVDVYAAFNGNLSLLGDDGLHPNASGYGVIADAFFAAIKNAFEVKTATPVLSFRRR